MSVLISLSKFFLTTTSLCTRPSLPQNNSLYILLQNVVFSCRSAAILILNPLISTIPLPLTPNLREIVFHQEKTNYVLLHLVMKALGALEHG